MQESSDNLRLKHELEAVNPIMVFLVHNAFNLRGWEKQDTSQPYIILSNSNSNILGLCSLRLLPTNAFYVGHLVQVVALLANSDCPSNSSVRTHGSTVMTSSSTVDELYRAETVCSYGAPSTVLDDDSSWIVVGKRPTKLKTGL